MHPLIYPTRFSKIKIMLLLVSIPGVLFGVFTEIFIGREFRAVVLECQLPNTTAVNLIMILLFLVPANFDILYGISDTTGSKAKNTSRGFTD